MSFDLEVLVVRQSSPVVVPFSEKIEVINEVDDTTVMRFERAFKFMSQTEGVWYSLVKEDRGLKDAYSLCTSDFEIDSKDVESPHWIEDEDVIDGLTPLIIYGEFADEFKRILKYLLGQSPSDMIMFVPRYQSKYFEIIQGVIPINKFFCDLDNNKILFNVCYIITSEEK